MIYHPAEDSRLLARALVSYVEGKKVIDIGAGSGVLSEAALHAGASSVCAVDIDSEVIDVLRLKRLTFIQSDLFENVSGSFDIIVSNPPYLPEDKREGVEGKTAIVGGKRGDELILRFLKQAPHHLSSDGVILLLLSSLTPQKRILELLKKQKLTHKIIAEHKLFFERLEVWKIIRN